MSNEIKGFEIDEWNIHGFNIGGKTDGKVASTCPFCSESRKKKKDKCATVYLDTGWFTCSHCGEEGQLHTYKRQNQVKTYEKPPKKLLSTKYSSQLTAWFKSRKIDVSTLQALSVTEGREWMPQTKCDMNVVMFNYFLQRELVNIKYRDGKKNFKLFKGAEKILYNIDAIFGRDEAVIVEGECFTGNTEILTPNGWVKFKDYTNENVMQVNDDLTCEFINPSAFIRKTYNDDLIELSNTKNYASLTTKNHNIPLFKNGVKKVYSAQEIYDSKSLRYSVQRAVKYKKKKKLNINNDLLRLYVAISADFTLRKYNLCYGGFKKKRKIDRITGILNRLNFSYSLKEVKHGYTQILIHGGNNYKPFKLFPKEWIGLLSAKQMNLIVEEMVFWDGNNVPNRNQTEYSSKEIHNAEFIQTVAHLSGYTSTIIPRKNDLGSWFKVSILKAKTTTSTQYSLSRKKVPHNGLVYCVTVKSGMILIRHKNNISVSGNCDALSYHQAGVFNVVSVPNGFNDRGDISLDYITALYEYFKNKKKIFLAVDNDDAGRKGQLELARRFGVEKVWLVDFKDCKDANEYLIKYGETALRKTIDEATQYPLENVKTVLDVKALLRDFYLNGKTKGSQVGLSEFDEIFSVYLGQSIVVTGVPSSGKSDFVDQMCVGYNLSSGWKIAFASPENLPVEIHADKILRKFAGFLPRTEAQLDSEAWKAVEQHVGENFFHIEFDAGFELKKTLVKAEELIHRKGVRVLVIDPYNKVRLKDSLNKGTTDYTNDYLNEIDMFARKHSVLVIVVAHPTKMGKNPDGTIVEPNMYDIKGGGEWYDMMPNGLLVHRDYARNIVKVKVLKVKFQWLGENQAECFFGWNINNGRYTEFDGFVDSDTIELPPFMWNNKNWITNDDAPKQEESLPEGEKLPVINPSDAFGAPATPDYGIEDDAFDFDDDIPF